MTATTASTYHALAATDPGFGATLQAEWTKVRSVRSTWIMVSLAIGLSLGFSALVSLITGLTFDSWGERGQGAFDPVLTPMSGWLFGIVLITVLSVTAVTSEYSSRMIRTTFIGNPRRLLVLGAKAVIVAGLGLVISAIAVPGMFLLSQPIYRAYGLPTASITDDAAVRLLLANVLTQGLIYALIPFSIAWLLRGTASAITVSLGFLFLPWMIAPIVPIWVQQNVLRYLPDMAANTLSGMTETDASTHLAQVPAIAVIVIWLAAMLAAAAFALNRRDV
jgi:ABC-2 type transport system permease protein